MRYFMYPVDFMIGALGALYIITDLLFEFAIEVVENGVKIWLKG